MKISLKMAGIVGEKVWLAETTADGVLISYGKAGRRPRTQTIPIAACVNGDPHEEAMARAEAKRNEGYLDVVENDVLTPKVTPVNKLNPLGLGDIKSNEWF